MQIHVHTHTACSVSNYLLMLECGRQDEGQQSHERPYPFANILLMSETKKRKQQEKKLRLQRTLIKIFTAAQESCGVHLQRIISSSPTWIRNISHEPNYRFWAEIQSELLYRVSLLSNQCTCFTSL